MLGRDLVPAPGGHAPRPPCKVPDEMISPSGQIEEVLTRVRDLPLAEVMELVKAEKRAAEAAWKREPPLSDARRHMWDYTQPLRCLLFWLTRKRKPRNCTAFPAFRPLTESLIRRGTLRMRG